MISRWWLMVVVLGPTSDADSTTKQAKLHPCGQPGDALAELILMGQACPGKQIDTEFHLRFSRAWPARCKQMHGGG